jgi:hypothetical protein
VPLRLVQLLALQFFWRNQHQQQVSYDDFLLL